MDHKGTILSQESLSTCGTNNSAFFRVDIEPNEMKYSMSDMSVGGLVNSLTRSYEETNDIICTNNINKSDTESPTPDDEANNISKTLDSTRINSQLVLVRSFQSSNTTSEDDVYSTPFNAGTIFRNHESSPNSPSDEEQEENVISPAHPVGSSNSDGTSVIKINSATKGLDTIIIQGNSASLRKNEGEQHSIAMSDEGSNKKLIEASSNSKDLTGGIPPTSIELELKGASQQLTQNMENRQSLQQAHSHITSITRHSNSTRTSCLTSETVVMEEKSMNESSRSVMDAMLASLRSQNSWITAQIQYARIAFSSFCSKKASPILSTCAACNDSIFESNNSSSRVETSLGSSCADKGIIVEKWARDMNIKVSELHDFIKCGSIASIDGTRNCGVFDIDNPTSSRSNRLIDSLLDNNSLLQSNGMVEKKLGLNDSNKEKEIRDISLVESNLCSDLSPGPDRKSATSVEIQLNDDASPQTRNVQEQEATEKFIQEVDEYAAILGINRAEFLTRVTTMIKEHTEQQQPKFHPTEGIENILDMLTTSCNPSNLSTSERRFNEDDQEERVPLVVNDNELNAKCSGSIVSLKDTTSSDLNTISSEESVPQIKLESSPSETKSPIEDEVLDVKSIHELEKKTNPAPANDGVEDDTNTAFKGDDTPFVTTKSQEQTKPPVVKSHVMKIHRRVAFGKSTNARKQSNRFVQRGRFRLMA